MFVIGFLGKIIYLCYELLLEKLLLEIFRKRFARFYFKMLYKGLKISFTKDFSI